MQILVAAAIPVAAGLEAPMWLVGGAGALIVALEGVQQLQQYQQNWTTYRSTAERLKHEKFLFLARSGAYASAERPRRSRPVPSESPSDFDHADTIDGSCGEAGHPAGQESRSLPRSPKRGEWSRYVSNSPVSTHSLSISTHQSSASPSVT